MGKITNSFDTFAIVAVTVFISVVIAQYAHHFLQNGIKKDAFGPLSADQRKNLLRIPGLLRLCIISRGTLIAFEMFHFHPTFIDLATIISATLLLFGNLCLYLGLITALRVGFDSWVTRSSKTYRSRQAYSGDNSKKFRIRKTRTLVNILLLPLGVIIFLPELNFDIPKQEILYSAALLFLVNALFLSMAISALEKEKPAAPVTKKPVKSSYERDLIKSIVGKDPDFPIIVDIISLFLDIVKHRLSADKETPGTYKLVEQDTSIAKYLFDLEVRLHNSWKKRRITIGRLAADSGSRSKCFYVIYDEYLVVKVPPEPITDSVEYLDSLKIEAELARQIDMEECIIPSLSVILKYVDQSIYAHQDSISSPEELATISLRRHPERYRFLKVGETFAYFMDMSKYIFLQKVIKTLHASHEPDRGVPFLRIKGPLEGIVANLLDLLAHINGKGVALRDLKPDNMLVAGDINNYPGFLSKPDEYVAGLIDIETGVIFGNPPLRMITQPQLGGTPHYATPSHFFTNDLLKHLYGDIADILHLQDWHGMIAVIFKAITTRYLFREASKTIPQITKRLDSITEAEEVLIFAINASRHFWSTAENEFKKNLSEERETLNKLQIRISKPVASMFTDRISAEQNDLNNSIRKLVTSQAISTVDAQKLLQATAQEIENFSGQWQTLSMTKTELRKSRPHTLRFLYNLREMKLEFESLSQKLELFSTPAPKITALLLLETMFFLLHQKMNRREWKKLPLKNLTELMNISSGNLSETILEETTKYQTLQDGPTGKL